MSKFFLWISLAISLFLISLFLVGCDVYDNENTTFVYEELEELYVGSEVTTDEITAVNTLNLVDIEVDDSQDEEVVTANIMGNVILFASIDDIATFDTDVVRVEVLDANMEWVNASPSSQNTDENSPGFYMMCDIYQFRVLEVFKGHTEVGDIIEGLRFTGPFDSGSTLLDIGDDIVVFLYNNRRVENQPFSMHPYQAAYRVLSTIVYPQTIMGTALTRSIPDDLVLESVNPNNNLTLTVGDLIRIAEENMPSPPSDPRRNILNLGHSRSFAITLDGTLWGFGLNSDGEIGNGTTINVPHFIPIMDDVVQVSSGQQHTLAIRNDGSLWAWGLGASGELGNGTGIGIGTSHTSPIRVLDNFNFVSVEAGRWYSLGLDADGNLWGWGSNMLGLMGDGTTINRHHPVLILDDVVDFSAGDNHALAVRSDGSLWGWGGNAFGNIGDGTNISRRTPVWIMDDVVAVETGQHHTIILRTDGSVWATGNNGNGQIGNGTTINQNNFIQVFDSAVAISAINPSSMALRADGSLWAWGFGNPTSHVPVHILDDVIIGADGSGHRLAVRTDGNLWGWGWKQSGPVGTGNLGILMHDIMPTGGSQLALGEGAQLDIADVSAATARAFDFLVADFDASMLEYIIIDITDQIATVSWDDDGPGTIVARDQHGHIINNGDGVLIGSNVFFYIIPERGQTRLDIQQHVEVMEVTGDVTLITHTDVENTNERITGNILEIPVAEVVGVTEDVDVSFAIEE